MTADQYTELVEFLGRKFDAIDRKFDAIDRRFDAIGRRLTAIEERVVALEERLTAVERRLTVLEVSHEAMRDDIRALAEGQVVINARVDRLEARLDTFENETRAGFAGLEVRFDRFEVDFGTVVLDHGRRIRALERPGKGAFLATAEAVFRARRDDPGFDLSGPAVGYAKAVETELNALIIAAGELDLSAIYLR